MTLLRAYVIVLGMYLSRKDMYFSSRKILMVIAITAIASSLYAQDIGTNNDKIADGALEAAPEILTQPQPSYAQPAHFNSNHIVVRTAARWANYQASVNHWGSKNISSAEELEKAMIDFASYDGASIAPGWMAVNALIALQVPEYVAGIRFWEKSYGRELVLQRVHQNPMASMQFPGSDKATAAILRASRSDSDKVLLVSQLFKEQAYSMQKKSWANKKQGGKDLRLSAINLSPRSPTPLNQQILQALAAPGVSTLETPYHSEQAKASFLSALKLGPRAAWANQSTDFNAPQLTPGREATIAKILGLATLMVLGEEPSHPIFRHWLDDVELRECIDWSRVHLNQCVAAGHFVFESSFCIAEHQLKDGGQCIGDIIDGSRSKISKVH